VSFVMLKEFNHFNQVSEESSRMIVSIGLLGKFRLFVLLF
jgi:hypothetical protein